MQKFRRVAHYYENNSNPHPPIEVLGTKVSDTEQVFVTTPYYQDETSFGAGGLMAVTELTPTTALIEDSTDSEQTRTLDMLLNASFQGNQEITEVVTTIPRVQMGKVALYEELGFVNVGDTRTESKSGRKVASEVIMLKHGDNKLASLALKRLGMTRARYLPDKNRPDLPMKWADGY